MHFTVDEVEAMIPALERIFVQVLQLRAGLHALGQKLDRAGLSPSRDGEADNDAGPPAVRQARAVFQGLAEALNDATAPLPPPAPPAPNPAPPPLHFPSTPTPA